MLKKFFCFTIILWISMFLFNISYATDIVMNLNNSAVSENATENVDTSSDALSSNVSPNYGTSVTQTTDYDSSTDLSISNMINIILIVVGVVMVLLGIVIIIKIK